MNGPLGSSVWVFHSGALGDHVMIWPLLRALARQGTHVTLVAASGHAKLAEREIGRQTLGAAGRVRGIGAEQARFTRMWRGEAESRGACEERVEAVLSFIADDESEPGRRWLAAAAAMFPGSPVLCVGAPGTESRQLLWARSNVRDWGKVAAARNETGSVTLFVGSGGVAKRWSMGRWAELAGRIGAASRIRLLAGPVEAERWTSQERDAFERCGGEMVGTDGDLTGLADAARGSRAFVGADSGPTHLAAQLGIPTIALFGPTDPAVWAPVGPRVRVVAPEAPGGMEWLTVERVVAEVRAAAALT